MKSKTRALRASHSAIDASCAHAENVRRTAAKEGTREVGKTRELIIEWHCANVRRVFVVEC